MTTTIEQTPLEDAVAEVVTTFAIDLQSGQVVDQPTPALVLDAATAWQENWQKIQGQTQVAIHFPKAVDGRGLSLAARIREASADVQLHAVGVLHADMVYFLRRCGFDFCHLSDINRVLLDENGRLPSSVLTPFSQHYQHSADSVAGQLGASVRSQVAATGTV